MLRLKLAVSFFDGICTCDLCSLFQSPHHATSNTCLSVRRACELVRTLVEQGDIRAALEAVPGQCQQALRVSHVAPGSTDLHLTLCGRSSDKEPALCALSTGSTADIPAEEAGGG